MPGDRHGWLLSTAEIVKICKMATPKAYNGDISPYSQGVNWREHPGPVSRVSPDSGWGAMAWLDPVGVTQKPERPEATLSGLL